MPCGTFSSAPSRTTHARFRSTWLSSSSFPPVQPMHITCASPWKAVYLDRFALHVAFPRSLVRHDSHDYYRSSVANFLSKGRRSRVSSRWYVLATDVGHPLISLLDLIGHRPQRRGCIRRETNLLHTVASISDVVSTGKRRPDWRLDFKQYSLTHIVRVLQRISLHVFG
ncbi:hypothetical protein Krac_11007 [Ktedonobacter racemifer DSM 44963]|uniref:Uncharacterized protein n=1 Tax=Ktedonobacter racemifer DSM 44963 TaxID=485913 RepID=D6TJ42_KTERA|nr:hypothetical protein Krac_11007 [Ktedonobacter racemifer DSM 44963]